MKISKQLHDKIIAGDILLRMIYGKARFSAYVAKANAGNCDYTI